MPVVVGPEYNASSTKYIETTSQKMYHSEPDPRNYPLKAKYRAGWITAPKQNKHSDNQGRGAHRVKLNVKQRAMLPYQPTMVKVVDLGRGTSRMMPAAQFEQLSWGWKIS